MDFDKKFPFSSVYKMTDYGLSLYTQEYVTKYLDEAAKEKQPKSKEDIEADKEDKKKFPKKSKVDTEPEINLGINNYI
jgi:hypothetical protein